jgi:hypothetical protein
MMMLGEIEMEFVNPCVSHNLVIQESFIQGDSGGVTATYGAHF